MLDLTRHGLNIWGITDRLKNEAENQEQMAFLLKWETYAYFNMMDHKKPYTVNMYDEAKIVGDFAVIGEFYKTEADFDEDNYQYIVPISYEKNGEYCIRYTIMDRKN